MSPHCSLMHSHSSIPLWIWLTLVPGLLFFNITGWGRWACSGGLSYFLCLVLGLYFNNLLHPKSPLHYSNSALLSLFHESLKKIPWKWKLILKYFVGSKNQSNKMISPYYISSNQVFRSHMKYLWWTDQTLNHLIIFLSITKCLHGLLLLNFWSFTIHRFMEKDKIQV